MENSDKQMEMLLQEGGIADDGASIDPVSGNEIPPGSMASEVRDDIPAQLSEGEYVVPADVLRFYGVKFFEDLRNEAKMGLANMEAEGRIGGEPVMDELPFADEELATLEGEDEPVQMNEGGMPGTQTTEFSTSAYQQDPSDPTQVIMGGSTKGYELITYYGPNGETVNIPFFNGMPLGLIPPGYTQSAPQDTAVETVAKESDNDSDDDAIDTSPKGPSISEMNGAQLAQEAKSAQIASAAAKAMPGLFGKVLSLATKGQQKAIDARAAKLGLVDPKDDPQKRSWGEQDDAGILTAQAMTPEEVQAGIDYAAEGDDRDTSWFGGQVADNQDAPDPDTSAEEAQSAAQEAADELGQDLATGGR
jgi:hypothetical protein